MGSALDWQGPLKCDLRLQLSLRVTMGSFGFAAPACCLLGTAFVVAGAKINKKAIP